MGTSRPIEQSLLVNYEPEVLAINILKRSEQIAPPIDLFRILSDLRIRSYDESLRKDGYLLKDTDGNGIIFYRGPKHQEGFRWRFTLAHEIGHWVLNELTNSGKTSVPATLDKVEAWCNRFASEILIPGDLLKEYLQKDNLTYSAISELKALFQVSEEALFLKLKSLNVEIEIVERRNGKLKLLQEIKENNQVSLQFVETQAKNDYNLLKKIAEGNEPFIVGPELIISVNRKIFRYFLIK